MKNADSWKKRRDDFFCTFGKRSRSIAVYCLKHRSGHILFAGCVLLVVSMLVAGTYENNSISWWNWLEPVTGTTTLAVALAVWLGELKQDWENSLPKRLTVVFLYQGRECMRCEEAYLAGESDIRAWGQQLGSQMAGTPHLRFQPSICQEQGRATTDPETGESFMFYRVVFTLSSLPEKFISSSGTVVNEREIALFKQNKKCVWRFSSRLGTFTEQEWLPVDDTEPEV